jgi:rifampicin phosphotransferase
MRSFICPFPSNESPTIAEVGGKGHALVQMSRFMPVPPGFILTTAFFEPWWQHLLGTDEWKQFEIATDRLLGAVTSQLKSHAMLLQFTDLQNDAIAEALEAFPGDQLFAVRSSSPEEDLEGTSFAGIYETVLGVTRKNIQAAVRSCFASCLDYRIIAYKREHGMDIHAPKIAVVIQQQIASDISGVAFSLNPLTNDFDEAIINANFGLGETVVQGDVTPDAWVVDKLGKCVIKREIGKKEKSIWLLASGGTKIQENPEGISKPCLTDSQVMEISGLVAAVEARSGKPSDIEFAYENEKLYLLQARPITAYQPLPPDLVTQAGRQRRLYLDVTRSVQGIERPLSEMGASVIKLLLSRASTKLLGRDLTDHIDRSGAYVTSGRVYANLSNFMTLVPMDALLDKIDMVDPLAVRALRSINAARYKATDVSFKTIPLQVAQRNPSLIGHFASARTSPEKYRDAALVEIETYKQQLQFLRRTKGSLRSYGNRVFDVALQLVFRRLVVMLITGLKARERIKKLAGPGFAADVDALTKALPGNVTVEMGMALYSLSKLLPSDVTPERLRELLKSDEIPALKPAWDEFISRYGHRAPEEFDIATPRFREQPDFLITQLVSLAKLTDSDRNPEQTYRQGVEKRVEAYYKLKKVFARKNLMNEIRLEASYRAMVSFLGFRESPKFCIMLAVDALRQRLTDVAAQLVARGEIDSPDHIWELSFEQVCASLEGTGVDLRAAVFANRARRRRLRLDSMPKIFDSRGRIIRPPAVAAKENELAGTAISAGLVTGTARVLHNPHEKQLNAGDILVARATDPGWTPLFATASAVVLEVGGALQHGALVAREYGLPCVSGIEKVTELIKDGSTIEVDGTNGIIRFVDQN